MRYECKECCNELMTHPCIIIIPGDKIRSRWMCIVTSNIKRANFVSIIEL